MAEHAWHAFSIWYSHNYRILNTIEDDIQLNVAMRLCGWKTTVTTTRIIHPSSPRVDIVRFLVNQIREKRIETSLGRAALPIVIRVFDSATKLPTYGILRWADATALDTSTKNVVKQILLASLIGCILWSYIGMGIALSVAGFTILFPIGALMFKTVLCVKARYFFADTIAEIAFRTLVSERMFRLLEIKKGSTHTKELLHDAYIALL